MSRFIDEGDRSQGTLLPERIDEYVSEENPVRVIDAFVAELDLARLGFDGVDVTTGRADVEKWWDGGFVEQLAEGWRKCGLVIEPVNATMTSL